MNPVRPRPPRRLLCNQTQAKSLAFEIKKAFIWRSNGVTFVEMLITLLISSFMITALSMTLVSGLKANQKANQNFSKYPSLRTFFFILEKDLRNMVNYSSLPFKGKESELEFPSLTVSHGKEAKGEGDLLRVHYFLKETTLIREEEPLKESLKKESRRKSFIQERLKKLTFEYAYKDEEGKALLFLPFWLEEPYQGLPKAIRITLELDQEGVSQAFTKLIDIPQGRVGVLVQEEALP